MALFYYSVEHRKFKLPTEALRRRKPQIAKRLRDSEYIEDLKYIVKWHGMCIHIDYAYSIISNFNRKVYSIPNRITLRKNNCSWDKPSLV